MSLFETLADLTRPTKSDGPPKRHKRWFLRWYSDEEEQRWYGDTSLYMNEEAALRNKDDLDAICVLFEGQYISSGCFGGLVKLSETRVRRVQDKANV